MRHPLHAALEDFFKEQFALHAALFWQFVPPVPLPFSPTLGASASITSGLVGFSFYSRAVFHGPDGARLVPRRRR